MTRILRPPVRALPLRADLVRLVLELAQDPSGLSSLAKRRTVGSGPWAVVDRAAARGRLSSWSEAARHPRHHHVGVRSGNPPRKTTAMDGGV